MRYFRLTLIFILITNLYAADSITFEFDKLKSEPQHKKVSTVIIKYLSTFHYQKRAIDDSLSSETFDRYFDKLDPSKVYFLQSDIDNFSKYRYLLDDYLSKGYVDPAFEIFNVYGQRIAERLTYTYAIINTSFDFTLDEYLMVDRSDVPWAKSQAKLDELWRKRVKNEVLNLRLSGKNPEEIEELLTKRYKRVQKNISQFQSEDVFQLMMNALSESFDPHTSYFSPKSFDDFRIQMSQAYSGIGARLSTEDDYTVIREIIAGGPADKSKLLQENDKIIGVGQNNNGEIVDVVGWRIDDVVQLIRGEKQTTVRLQIMEAGSAPGAYPDTIALVRDKIKIEDRVANGKVLNISSEGKKFNFGVIDIPQFYSDFEGRNAGEKDYTSTTHDVKRILKELRSDTLDGVIIDLRRNGGGFLNEAIDLTGLFIEKGPVVQVRSTTGKVSVEWDDNSEQVYNGPLAVLVDRISASASEIFAAAIQDYNRGIIVGSQTFGKGTVQNAIPLDRFLPHSTEKLGQLKITVAKFYRINGGSTQHIGVIPDISFPSRFNIEEIGESSEKNALLWDQIKPVNYDTYLDIEPVIPKLKLRHVLRTNEDPLFAEMQETLNEIEKNRNIKELSLNLEVRQKLREEADLKKKKNEGEDGDGDEEEDLLLLESARVLSDYIMIADD
jgi:carboxyl-terminal processing protease